MLYGIQYDANKKGLKKASDNLEKFGSAIVVHGKCDLYFRSKIQAFFTAMELTKSHDDVTYKIFVHNPIIDKEVTEENIVSTKEEYFQKMNERTQALFNNFNKSEPSDNLEK